MKMLLIGMLIMYLLLCLVATISEIVKDSEWVLVFILLPVIVICEVIRFIWVKVIHYGKVRVHSIDKGYRWKKKSEVAENE